MDAAGDMWARRLGESPMHTYHYRCMWGDCEQLMNAKPNGDTALLQEHMDSHLSELGKSSDGVKWVCRVRNCEIVVSSQDELNRHLKMHLFHAKKQFKGLVHVDSRGIRSCNFPPSSRIVYQGEALFCDWGDCMRSFADINLYFQHLHIHVDELEPCDNGRECIYLCEWKGCTASAKHKASLRHHVQHHSGDKMCACPFCGAFFANNTKLIDHVSRRRATAEQNEKDSTDESANKKHFSCFFCLKSFATARLLKNHCQRHVRNFKCPYCSMALDSEGDLRRHVAAVHAKIRNHHCDICQRGFFQFGDLAKHLRSHMANPPKFKCPKCEKSYKWEKQLRHHIRSHEENHIDSPYLCHLCSHSYRRGSALSKHFRVLHQLQLPDGFSRFQYKRCADGFIRLQTRRCLGKNLIAHVDEVD